MAKTHSTALLCALILSLTVSVTHVGCKREPALRAASEGSTRSTSPVYTGVISVVSATQIRIFEPTEFGTRTRFVPVDEETEVYSSDGEAMEFGELAAGQTIRVWFEGATAKGNAKRLVVERRRKKKSKS